MIEIEIPASKSISNRILVLAAFTGKGKVIRNILKSEDTQVMFEAFEILGVKYSVLHEDIESLDIQILEVASAKMGKFFMNNSGTSTRFLIPCLALLKGEFILDGVERMRERPIKDLIDALSDLGVTVNYLEKDGYLPLKIVSTGVLEGSAKIRCDLSSQYLSGLMLARSICKSFKVEIIGESIVSKPYIDLTTAVIIEFYSKQEIIIEPDFSSASYFVALGVMALDEVLLIGLSNNSLQADKKFVEVLSKMGADLNYIEDGLVCRKSTLSSIKEIDCTDFPDSAMTLAIVCSLFDAKTTRLTGLSTLRHKECDRLMALKTEFLKVGVIAEITDDSITVQGISTAELKPALIETYNDHRMAMCFAILKYFNNQIEILNPSCVNKTFPEFWNKLGKLA